MSNQYDTNYNNTMDDYNEPPVIETQPSITEPFESLASYCQQYHFEPLIGRKISDCQRYEIIDAFNYMLDEMPYDNKLSKFYHTYNDYCIDKFINVMSIGDKVMNEFTIKNVLRLFN